MRNTTPSLSCQRAKSGIIIGMNPELKRHLISAGVTFLQGFVIGILPYVQTIDLSNLGKATAFAIVMVGVRAGIKYLVEKFVVVPPAPQIDA